MKENKYDDPVFFEKYSQMERSQRGLDGAGEWHELKKVLPDFKGRRVLDLGCGYGWHCGYAAEHGAVSVTGLDLSEKMLDRAKELFPSDKITYVCNAIEDFESEPGSYDLVLSSLALHYVTDFYKVCQVVHRALKEDGSFVFSVEHPVFTAYGSQDWYYDEHGKILHWPVDGYYVEGERQAVFLGEKVQKYHKTLTSYINSLLKTGFELTDFVEPMPSQEMLEKYPGMKDELRRPMMLIVGARKRG